MIRRVLFFVIFFGILAGLSSLVAKRSLAVVTGSSMRVYFNNNGSIPISVDYAYKDANGYFHNDPSTPDYKDVPANTTGVAGYYFEKVGSFSEPVEVWWRTSCIDPFSLATGTRFPGDPIVSYQATIDVTCTTSNGDPQITSISCPSPGNTLKVGWQMTGGGPYNVDFYYLWLSTGNPAHDYDGTPDTYGSINSQNDGPYSGNFTWNGLSPGTTYYVSVSSVPPQRGGNGHYHPISDANTKCTGVVATPTPTPTPTATPWATPTPTPGVTPTPTPTPAAGTGTINLRLGSCSGSSRTVYVDYTHSWPDGGALWQVQTQLNSDTPVLWSAPGDSGTLPFYPPIGVTFYGRLFRYYTRIDTASVVVSNCTVVPPTATPTPTPIATPTPPPPGNFPKMIISVFNDIDEDGIYDGASESFGSTSYVADLYIDDAPIISFKNSVTTFKQQVSANQSFHLTLRITDPAWVGTRWLYQEIDCSDSGSPCYTVNTVSGNSYSASYPDYSADVTIPGWFGNYDGKIVKLGLKKGTAPTPTPTPTPTPSPSPTLSVTLYGRVNSTDTWSATSVSGNAPLNDVDLRAVVGGSPSGNIRYRFDCTNDGTYEDDFVTTSTIRFVNDICDYPTAGSYTAAVRVDNGALFATDTLAITAVGQPKPREPSDLRVEVSCDAVTRQPVLTFSFQDNATNEGGFYLDVTKDWNGRSFWPWNYKELDPSSPASSTGSRIEFPWQQGNALSVLDPAAPTEPALNTTYWWRVVAFNADGSRQSDHVYPLSTTTAPGESITTPATCAGSDLTLDVTPKFIELYTDPARTKPAASFAPGDTMYVRINIKNAGGEITSQFKNAFYINRTSGPAVNDPPDPSYNPPLVNTELTLLSMATGDVEIWDFEVPAPPEKGVKTAYVFVDYQNNIPEDNGLGTAEDNNIYSQPYSVETNAWFETTGGDVGSGGEINASLAPPDVPPQKFNSTYLLASVGEQTNVLSEKGWVIRKYAGHNLIPAGTTVYGYLESRFKDKAKGANIFCGSDPSGLLSGRLNYCDTAGSDLTLSPIGPFNKGDSVWFIDGNLIIDKNLIVTGNSTLTLVVSGDITIKSSVSRADGVYVAGGTFTDADDAPANTGDQLVINGAVYAQSVSLIREFKTGAQCEYPEFRPDPNCSVTDDPVDVIIFVPRYLVVLASKDLLGSQPVSWREVAP